MSDHSLEVDSITITSAQKLQDVFRRRFRMLVVILWAPPHHVATVTQLQEQCLLVATSRIKKCMSIGFDGQNRRLSDVGYPNKVGLKYLL